MTLQELEDAVWESNLSEQAREELVEILRDCAYEEELYEYPDEDDENEGYE